ncbi:unnamed protein product [Alopecurus aequalis]
MESGELMLDMSKYILLLATVVATVTYAVGFSPPGGVWQDTDAAAGRFAGDSIIRSTNNRRYLAFYYCNATAFASSLVVIFMIFSLALVHDKRDKKFDAKPLQVAMVLGLLSLMGAYAAGTCRDTFTIVYSSVLVGLAFAYLVLHRVVHYPPSNSSNDGNRLQEKPSNSSNDGDRLHEKPSNCSNDGDKLHEKPSNCSNDGDKLHEKPSNCSNDGDKLHEKPSNCSNDGDKLHEKPSNCSNDGDKLHEKPSNCSNDGDKLHEKPSSSSDDGDKLHEKRLRKVLMLLATFAISVTYVAGMSTPGGFWDAGSGHPPGHAILADGHGKRLTVFLCFNAAAFLASLVIVVRLLDKRPRLDLAYGCMIVVLISVVVAYTAGSCRNTDTTVYVSSLVGAVFIFILLLQYKDVQDWIKNVRKTCFCVTIEKFYGSVSKKLGDAITKRNNGRNTVDKASSLVLLLATLAATVTYQAGLSPPGGFWPENGDGHMAGDPILLTTNPRRFKAFFYCNSIAFVASLVAIILVQNKFLLETHVLEAAMILDLFGLIGAYAAGSCRDVTTSIYAMALAGAVLVYVVVHVVFFTLNHTDTITERQIELVDKRRKRLLLFAVLAATITYQAGLTPPGGFRLQDDGSSGHYAGDPVLNNFPHRYTAFFYCNSVSFMLSVALIILLVNPHLYRPSIRSYALDICSVAGMLSLMGAYAAGSTQSLKTSIYIFVLAGVVLFVIVGLVLYNAPKDGGPRNQPKPKNNEEEEEEKAKHAKRKYLMVLGILVASVTYQAGLSPPGGAWQSSSDWYNAGNPVMHDNRRAQYLVFFYSNSISLVASIVVIVLLLPMWKDKKDWSLNGLNTTIFLDLLALLGAYAAGSSRGWKTAMYVVALIFAVLAYIAVHIVLALSCPPTADTSAHETSPAGPGNDPQRHDQTHEATSPP